LYKIPILYFQSTMRLATHNIFTEVLGIYILQVAVIVKKIITNMLVLKVNVYE